MRAVCFPLIACSFYVALAWAGLSLAVPPGSESDASQTATTTPAPDPAFYDKRLRPFLKQHCWSCHAGAEPEGELRLDLHQTAASLSNSRDTWAKVVHALKAGKMPPKDEPKPTAEDVDAVASWLDRAVNYVDCDAPSDPGHVTLRRLTRVEYQNTIRDLLGIDFQLPEDFPADDVGYGFDNIGDVLTMPPLLLEKYLAAAEQAAAQVLVELRPSSGKPHKIEAAQIRATANGRRDGDGWWLNSNGRLFVDHQIPHPGDYTLRVYAEGDQAGDEPAKMGVLVDGRRQKVFEVKNEGRIETFELQVTLDAKKHRIEAEFLNDYYHPQDPDPAKRDRNLFVQSFELIGPKQDRGSEDSTAVKRVLVARPDAQLKPADAARAVLRRLATRAYRRPATDAELSRLMKFVETSLAREQSFEEAITLALRAILVSPNFLFKLEIDPPAGVGDPVRQLNEYELAVRLSYFLWSTMPDDELFQLAQQKQLRANLPEQVARMLRDQRSRALADNFATQWLGLRNLEMMQPDPQRFAMYDAQLQRAMHQESTLFFDEVFRKDRSLLDLLSADFTFVNERLARHYGIKGVQGPQFREVKVDGLSRGGIMTQASVLTVTSNPTRTSPVKRGKWIMENILGTPPPPPPPDVPALEETQQAREQGSMRQRLEIHRSNPTCASCHEQMDPLGFAMENFNPIGAWRNKDGRFEIDAAGELSRGQRFDSPQQLKELLRNEYHDDFLHCLTEKMLTYALGRGVEIEDRCVVNEICSAVQKNGYKPKTLILEIVTSDAFQKRRGPDATRQEGGKR